MNAINLKPEPLIDAVLCDVGDVVIMFDQAVAADIESRHRLEPGSLLPAMLKSREGKLAMIGHIDRDDWRQAMVRKVGEGAVAEWLDYHGDVNHRVVALLKELRSLGVHVVLLSNATTRLWDDLAFHGLDALADAIFCSADIGRAKPDPDSYRHAARRGGFRLDQALYVDDTPSWVAAAARLGMHGHVFESAQVLRRDLVARGLLP
ncbi:MAG TPA: HAD-IA family hydrolase [Streptosporangiaceae bacterium]